MIRAFIFTAKLLLRELSVFRVIPDWLAKEEKSYPANSPETLLNPLLRLPPCVLKRVPRLLKSSFLSSMRETSMETCLNALSSVFIVSSAIKMSSFRPATRIEFVLVSGITIAPPSLLFIWID